MSIHSTHPRSSKAGGGGALGDPDVLVSMYGFLHRLQEKGATLPFLVPATVVYMHHFPRALFCLEAETDSLRKKKQRDAEKAAEVRENEIKTALEEGVAMPGSSGAGGDGGDHPGTGAAKHSRPRVVGGVFRRLPPHDMRALSPSRLKKPPTSSKVGSKLPRKQMVVPVGGGGGAAEGVGGHAEALYHMTLVQRPGKACDANTIRANFASFSGSQSTGGDFSRQNRSPGQQIGRKKFTLFDEHGESDEDGGLDVLDELDAHVRSHEQVVRDANVTDNNHNHIGQSNTTGADKSQGTVATSSTNRSGTEQRAQLSRGVLHHGPAGLRHHRPGAKGADVRTSVDFGHVEALAAYRDPSTGDLRAKALGRVDIERLLMHPPECTVLSQYVHHRPGSNGDIGDETSGAALVHGKSGGVANGGATRRRGNHHEVVIASWSPSALSIEVRVCGVSLYDTTKPLKGRAETNDFSTYEGAPSCMFMVTRLREAITRLVNSTELYENKRIRNFRAMFRFDGRNRPWFLFADSLQLAPIPIPKAIMDIRHETASTSFSVSNSPQKQHHHTSTIPPPPHRNLPPLSATQLNQTATSHGGTAHRLSSTNNTPFRTNRQLSMVFTESSTGISPRPHELPEEEEDEPETQIRVNYSTVAVSPEVAQLIAEAAVKSKEGHHKSLAINGFDAATSAMDEAMKEHERRIKAGKKNGRNTRVKLTSVELDAVRASLPADLRNNPDVTDDILMEIEAEMQLVLWLSSQKLNVQQKEARKEKLKRERQEKLRRLAEEELWWASLPTEVAETINRQQDILARRHNVIPAGRPLSPKAKSPSSSSGGALTASIRRRGTVTPIASPTHLTPVSFKPKVTFQISNELLVKSNALLQLASSSSAEGGEVVGGASSKDEEDTDAFTTLSFVNPPPSPQPQAKPLKDGDVPAKEVFVKVLPVVLVTQLEPHQLEQHRPLQIGGVAGSATTISPNKNANTSLRQNATSTSGGFLALECEDDTTAIGPIEVDTLLKGGLPWISDDEEELQSINRGTSNAGKRRKSFAKKNGASRRCSFAPQDGLGGGGSSAGGGAGQLSLLSPSAPPRGGGGGDAAVSGDDSPMAPTVLDIATPFYNKYGALADRIVDTIGAAHSLFDLRPLLIPDGAIIRGGGGDGGFARSMLMSDMLAASHLDGGSLGWGMRASMMSSMMQGGSMSVNPIQQRQPPVIASPQRTFPSAFNKQLSAPKSTTDTSSSSTVPSNDLYVYRSAVAHDPDSEFAGAIRALDVDDRITFNTLVRDHSDAMDELFSCEYLVYSALMQRGVHVSSVRMDRVRLVHDVRRTQTLLADLNGEDNHRSSSPIKELTAFDAMVVGTTQQDEDSAVYKLNLLEEILDKGHKFNAKLQQQNINDAMPPPPFTVEEMELLHTLGFNVLLNSRYKTCADALANLRAPGSSGEGDRPGSRQAGAGDCGVLVSSAHPNGLVIAHPSLQKLSESMPRIAPSGSASSTAAMGKYQQSILASQEAAQRAILQLLEDMLPKGVYVPTHLRHTKLSIAPTYPQEENTAKKSATPPPNHMVSDASNTDRLLGPPVHIVTFTFPKGSKVVSAGTIPGSFSKSHTQTGVDREDGGDDDDVTTSHSQSNDDIVIRVPDMGIGGQSGSLSLSARGGADGDHTRGTDYAFPLRRECAAVGVLRVRDFPRLFGCGIQALLSRAEDKNNNSKMSRSRPTSGHSQANSTYSNSQGLVDQYHHQGHPDALSMVATSTDLFIIGSEMPVALPTAFAWLRSATVDKMEKAERLFLVGGGGAGGGNTSLSSSMEEGAGTVIRPILPTS